MADILVQSDAGLKNLRVIILAHAYGARHAISDFAKRGDGVYGDNAHLLAMKTELYRSIRDAETSSRDYALCTGRRATGAGGLDRRNMASDEWRADE